MRKFVGPGPILTDNRPFVEYYFGALLRHEEEKIVFVTNLQTNSARRKHQILLCVCFSDYFLLPRHWLLRKKVYKHCQSGAYLEL